MSDAKNADQPRPVHDRCSAADGPQAPGDDDRSADANDCKCCGGIGGPFASDLYPASGGLRCKLCHKIYRPHNTESRYRMS
jgi:hypothetical protein